MSTKTIPAPLSAARKGRGDKPALERLNDLEKVVPMLAQQTNLALQDVDKKLDGLVRILEAVVDQVGPKEVYELMERRRLEEQQKREVDEAAALQSLVTAGKIVSGSVVTEESFVVLLRSRKDGTGTPTRLQSRVGALVPEVRSKVLTCGVGAVVDLNESESLRVAEIYLEATKPEAVKGEVPASVEMVPAPAPDSVDQQQEG